MVIGRTNTNAASDDSHADGDVYSNTYADPQSNAYANPDADGNTRSAAYQDT